MLVTMLRRNEFRDGDTTTKFIDEIGLDVLSAPLAGEERRREAIIAAALADAADNRSRASVDAGLPSGWRNLPSATQTKNYTLGENTDETTVRYRVTRDGVVLPDDPAVSVKTMHSNAVTLTVAGVDRIFRVRRRDDARWVDFAGGSVTLSRAPRFVDPAEMSAPGSLLAPMPGSIIRIAVVEGQTVTKGEPLLWLEAMKMEHTISASADGIVEKLPIGAGQQVAVGEVLAVISEHRPNEIEGESA